MKAMRLHHCGELGFCHDNLVQDSVPVPQTGTRQVLVEVHYCGVCHTELDEIEGRALPARLPVIPGHQVVGRVVSEGPGCERGLLGQTIGLAWIYSSCGTCAFCRSGKENLCPAFEATGKDRDGGYAGYVVANEAFVLPIPAQLDPARVAPLLCAGAVGYRSLRLAGLKNDTVLGLCGFGSSNRLVLQMARALYPQIPIQVFARSAIERDLAFRLGASWAGDTEAQAPFACSAIIDTTPVWAPVLASLRQLAPGGRLVINAIRKETADLHLLAKLDYARQLWQEKSIQTVANVSREDVSACLALAATHALDVSIEEYPLEQACEALRAIRAGDIRASAVLRVR
jgi:propanol-preferring alcohol dehydrogenase